MEEAKAITPVEAKAMLDRGEKMMFLDARNPEAWGASREKVPGAIRVRPEDLQQHLSEIPVDGTIIAYCT